MSGGNHPADRSILHTTNIQNTQTRRKSFREFTGLQRYTAFTAFDFMHKTVGSNVQYNLRTDYVLRRLSELLKIAGQWLVTNVNSQHNFMN